jgi:hypothetical protein
MKIFKIKNHNGSISTVTIKKEIISGGECWRVRLNGNRMDGFDSQIKAENYVKASYNIIKTN